ncbi:MAG: hypothetical protein M3N39_08630, partial [Pseudomonadota bacterium]|nr:hypothetical protein [Pseudomonadota bacterium]
SYTTLLPSAPAVNGKTGLARGEHELERAELRAEGFEFKIDVPVTIHVDEGQMIVRLKRAAQAQLNRLFDRGLASGVAGPYS